MMCYTAEQKNLIGALIDTCFMGRNLPEKVRNGFHQAYHNLEADSLNVGDLRLIKNALELITPQSCQSCSKESYRDMIEALTTARRMLTLAGAE